MSRATARRLHALEHRDVQPRRQSIARLRRKLSRDRDPALVFGPPSLCVGLLAAGIGEATLLVGHAALTFGDRRLPRGFDALAVGIKGREAKRNRERRQHDDRRPGERERAAVLAKIVAVEVVLRTSVEGRGEVEYRAAKPRMPERQLFALVDPVIFATSSIVEATAQAIRQRRGDRPVEVPTRRVPRNRAARERDQHLVWLARRQERFDLARNPGRRSRGWRGEEQQVFGVVECPFDGAPERRVGGKACLVPEDTEARYRYTRAARNAAARLESILRGGGLPRDCKK